MARIRIRTFAKRDRPALRALLAAMRFYRAHGWSVRGEGKDAGGAYFVLEQGTVAGR